MIIFDVLIFSAAFIIIYLYWNTPSELPVEETVARPTKAEGFDGSGGDIEISASDSQVANISMCPGISKSFVAKNGDNLCCEGNIAGTDCEGITICTLSSTGSHKYPSCGKYLEKYYFRKGLKVCPRSLPHYYEDDLGGKFCTNSRLNKSMNGPHGKNTEKCTVDKKGAGYMDPQSCEVQVALDRMPCPSPGCTKQPIGRVNEPIILMAHFNDSTGIKHSCYDKESMFRFWESVYGPDWKAKTSHINPDRNIMFCDVAKTYYIDKTLSKNLVEV